MKKRIVIAMLSVCLFALGGCQAARGRPDGDRDWATGETTGSETEERPEYRALDYVTLGEYKGLTVTMASTDPSEDEIDQRIETELAQNNKLEEITEGTVGKGTP